MVAQGILLIILTAASSFRPLPGVSEPMKHSQTKPDVAAKGEAKVIRSEGRSGLPYAFGRTFANLDAYLLHLQQVAAPVDLPWWRKVGPDRFERMTGRRMPQDERRFATRAELARQYGFAR